MTNNTPFKPKQIYVDTNKLEVIEPKLPPMPVIAKSQNVSSKAETPQDAEIADIENQIAMAQTLQDNNSQFKRSAEEEELKKKTIANILSQINTPVPTPRYLTIQDLFNKNADLSGVVGTFNPNVSRAINSMFGTKVFGDNGKIIDLAEEDIQNREAEMQAERQRAFELQKQRNNLAPNIYNLMNAIDTEAMREDRFNRQLAQQADQFAQTLNAKREDRNYERMREDEAIQRQIDQQNFLNDLKEKEYQLEKDKLDFAKEKEGLGGGIGKMPAADKKILTENNTTIKNIEAGIEAIEKNPNAYRAGHLFLAPEVLNNYASWTGKNKDIETRAQIDNITAVYRKWLTGAQMSDKERKDYERFLPAKGDNAQIIKSKLKAMKESIERSNQALLDNYNITPQTETVDSDPMGLGF